MSIPENAPDAAPALTPVQSAEPLAPWIGGKRNLAKAIVQRIEAIPLEEARATLDADDTKGLSNVVPIDAGRMEDRLRQIVRGSVEETLNSLLEAEAGGLCNSGRHERSEAGGDTRAGSIAGDARARSKRL